jgi:hypothetical protein
MLKITVLAALAVAAPLFGAFVGPEVPLSTPVVDAAPGLRELPAVASNGTGFLVVWREQHGLLRGVRVDVNGVIRDSRPLTLGTMRFTFSAGTPSVASDGDDYVAAYACGESIRPAVCFTHVDADSGAVTPRGTIDQAENAVIASNGTGYLAAYTNRSRGVDAVPLRADGTFAGDALTVTSAPAFTPAIAANGTNYFVVFGTNNLLEGVLLSERGFRAQRQRLSDVAPSHDYAVASDGSGFMVVWLERLPSSHTQTRAAVVSAGGAASPSFVAAPLSSGFDYAMAWDGADYVVTMTTLARNIARMKIGLPPAPIADRLRRVGESAIAATPQTALVVWTNQHGNSAVIEGRLFTRDEGSPIITLSVAVTAQQSPAAMHNGARTVVAWDENVGAEPVRKVFVQRLDANGLPLDGRGLPVGESPARHQLRPALAGGIVAWVEVDAFAAGDLRGQVWASVLDFSGAPVGPPRFIGEAAATSRVAVAAPNGPLQYIVWESAQGKIMAARIAPYARIGYDPTPFAISSGPNDRDPVVASHSRGFVVAWNREDRNISCIPGCQFPTSIHAAAFTEWGDLVGTYAISAPDASQPVLTWNGSEHVLFWTDLPTGEAYAQKLATTGTPIGAARPLGRMQIEAADWAPAQNEYRIAFWGFGHESLWIGRLDRDLNLVASTPSLAQLAAPGVVLLDELLIYLAPYDGTELLSSRVVARRIGEDVPPPRRRATAH